MISLLFDSLCYFLIISLMFFNILFYVCFLFCTFFCLVYSVFLYSFCIVLCIVAPFVLSLSYFCTSLPTTIIGWKSNWSNKYHIISYHIISCHIMSFYIKTQKLSTCNDVSVTWVAEVSWMDLHQPRCWNNCFAVFLWTNLHQHFAYMFTSRHVPATELLHVSVWFSDNSNVMFATSLW